MKHDPENKPHTKGKGIATVQLSTTVFFGKEDLDRNTSSRKGKPRQHALLF